MKEKVIEFLWRLTSRKFWLALGASITAYKLGMQDGVIDYFEIVATIAPLMAFIGFEGWADAVRE